MQNNALKIISMKDILKWFLGILSSILPWWSKPELVQTKEPDFLPEKWMTVYNHLFLNATEDSIKYRGEVIKELLLSLPVDNWKGLPDPPKSWQEGQVGDDEGIVEKQMFLLLSLWKKIGEADQSMGKPKAQYKEFIDKCLKCYNINKAKDSYIDACSALHQNINEMIESAKSYKIKFIKDIEDVRVQIEESEARLRQNKDNKLRSKKILGIICSLYLDYLFKQLLKNHQNLIEIKNSHLKEAHGIILKYKEVTTDEGIESIAKGLREQGEACFPVELPDTVRISFRCDSEQ